MPHAKEEETCQGDDWNKTCENYNYSENSQLLGIIKTVKENHSFSSSLRERIIEIFSAIVS